MGSFVQIRVYDDKISIWNDGGLIDAWGRGTVKIIETCLEAGLPESELIERDGGFWVTLFKNSLTEEQLVKLGLNARQIKAVQYVKEKGKITNKQYQEINQISNRTATYELKELFEKFGISRDTIDLIFSHYYNTSMTSFPILTYILKHFL